jgi:hypothetical protein
VTPLDIQRLVAPWALRYKPNTVRRYYAVVRAVFAADAEAWVFPGPKGGPLRYANFHDRVWVPAREQDSPDSDSTTCAGQRRPSS